MSVVTTDSIFKKVFLANITGVFKAGCVFLCQWGTPFAADMVSCCSRLQFIRRRYREEAHTGTPPCSHIVVCDSGWFCHGDKNTVVEVVLRQVEGGKGGWQKDNDRGCLQFCRLTVEEVISQTGKPHDWHESEVSAPWCQNLTGRIWRRDHVIGPECGTGFKI